jgi:hypothetical protein
MPKSIKYLLVVFALFGLAGCDKKEGADSAPMSSDAEAPMAANEAEGASLENGGTQLAITNPMPHDMTVTADWGAGPQELGTVAANSEATFAVTAAAGTTVTLVATDAGKTHSPSGTVTLESGSAAKWTIQ